MSRRFSPEEHQQFLAAMRIVDDPTQPSEERLASCQLVIWMCTQPTPMYLRADPEPYCPGWLDAFGRAHDLRKQIFQEERETRFARLKRRVVAGGETESGDRGP